MIENNFGFFGPVTFLYSCFYAFCMFHNGSGVTFPFFIAASLLYLCFSLSKLEITLQKGSVFYMISMMLLAVSTFSTDDWRIIAMNKTGIYLLMMSLLLKQFVDTSKWGMGKYLESIILLTFGSIGELGRPFKDGAHFLRTREKKGKGLYVALGMLIAFPLLAVVLALLASADAVFRDMTDRIFSNLNFDIIMNVCFRIGFLFFASYLMLSFLCKKTFSAEVQDRRKGEPLLAITITTLLSLIYLVFSGIQIIYLFLGQMQLPEGYTYAEYAREGFFQLLAVSILNLVIVLFCMTFFRDSKLLKGVLIVMSLCTFIMIASSALRMIIYIRYYYMTFLRLFVLWALALLAVLFVGVIANIVRATFPLFRYSVVAVTILYLALSFSHPDYIIAAIDVANAPLDGNLERSVSEEDFFQNSSYYNDYLYLGNLSADAAPILLPYLDELGCDLTAFYDEEMTPGQKGSSIKERFGYIYLKELQQSTKNFSIRTFNISRYMALKDIKELLR